MLHLPETAHLYVLLNCAQFNQKTYLEPELESYLIQTLMRYSEMLETEQYSTFYEPEQVEEFSFDSDHDYLKEIADYCLICTGLMSDRFIFEETSFERLQEVGQNAFTLLSDAVKTDDNIYKKLSVNFSRLVEILNYSQNLIEEDSQLVASLSNNTKYSVMDFREYAYHKGEHFFSDTNILLH